MLRLDPRTLETLSQPGDIYEELDYDPYDHKGTTRAPLSEDVGLGGGCVDVTAQVVNLQGNDLSKGASSSRGTGQGLMIDVS